MARATGARAQLAAAFETTYGTAPASSYTKMPFARAALGSEQPLLSSELLGYGRDPLAPVLDAVTADGSVTVPIDLEAFGIWLKGAFGAPTTSGTTNFTHTFKTGASSLPSMSIEVGLPEVPHFAMYKGCMVDTLGWSMARSGLVTAEVGLVAQAEAKANATAAGTPSAVTLERFGAFQGAVKQGGNALANIVSADIRYANGLDRVETIRADGLIDGIDPGIASLTGSITARFSDTALLDQAISGTSSTLEFSYTINTNKSLTLTAHAVWLPRPRISIDGPGGVQATFDWQASLPSSGTGNMATIVLKNQRATY
ncbi:phage tail tube protein [Paracoccus chinensis]|uniref:Phage tail tube protein n=1 Tax=Paracoccus chinensis TaxID=525640 RepID=A0A1G9JIT3_9RHOB|nr:phage tail tube protein [Paracoccus chinensis]SDL37136.1 hypothetical protein SAMN04487971_109143 [Paracoccus chinensis]